MNIEMLPVEIIGLKSDLNPILLALRKLGCVQIDEIGDSPLVSARPLVLDKETIARQEELSLLLARVNGLLGVLPTSSVRENAPSEVELDEVRSSLNELAPKVQALIAHRDELQSKLAMLPRYEATLRKLLPIIPPSVHLPGRVSIGVLVSRMNVGVLDSITSRILELTGGRAEVVGSDIDSSTRAMFTVFPREFTSEIESLLGREDVARLRLPVELGSGPPDVAFQALRRQLVVIPEEINQINHELAGLTTEWSSKLVAWRDVLLDKIEVNSVLSRFGETDMTFVLAGWIPVKEFENLRTALQEAIGETIQMRQLPMTEALKKAAPVMLKNPPIIARPFESLVNLLALPRYGHIDPTLLMAFFMPIFFGMILGDIGYGALLLALSLVLLRKRKAGVFRDLLIVLAIGSGWAIVFGFLFGELFGNLGEQLGLRPIWFDRASPENVAGLLLMTVAIGAVHVTLGLILGIWEGIKDRSRSHLLERGGMLIGLIGMFLIVGVLAKVLPDELMTPAIAGLIVGVVLLGASLGWLGILMGPIEFIGLIGNVLSYLRIAAIGLASVYLARVANDLAGIAGNIIVGVILAVMIHALNLALGAFSPTIHSLRLHYVEFFRKFYEGGGRPYQPYKSRMGKV
jgi:V/A-type H+/Na+-transporting ATPase subunit I